MIEEKPFQASAKRLKEARQQGKLLRSPILSLCFSVLIWPFLGFFAFGSGWLRFQMLLNYLLATGFSDPALSFRRGAILVALVVGLTLGLSSLMTVSTEAIQTGFLWCPRAGRRFSVVEGSQRIIKDVGAVHWVALKVLSILGVVLFLLTSAFYAIVALPMPPPGITDSLINLIGQVWLRLWACLLVLGGAEYFIRRRNFRAELSMSYDEMRRDLKEEEGDPYLKAVRGTLHQAILTRQIVEQVRKSRVLIVERT